VVAVYQEGKYHRSSPLDPSLSFVAGHQTPIATMELIMQVFCMIHSAQLRGSMETVHPSLSLADPMWTRSSRRKVDLSKNFESKEHASKEHLELMMLCLACRK
jgi:hypothetical protein